MTFRRAGRTPSCHAILSQFSMVTFVQNEILKKRKKVKKKLHSISIRSLFCYKVLYLGHVCHQKWKLRVHWSVSDKMSRFQRVMFYQVTLSICNLRKTNYLCFNGALTSLNKKPIITEKFTYYSKFYFVQSWMSPLLKAMVGPRKHQLDFSF